MWFTSNLVYQQMSSNKSINLMVCALCAYAEWILHCIIAQAKGRQDRNYIVQSHLEIQHSFNCTSVKWPRQRRKRKRMQLLLDCRRGLVLPYPWEWTTVIVQVSNCRTYYIQHIFCIWYRCVCICIWFADDSFKSEFSDVTTPLREQDLFLPIANITKVIKQVLPKHGKVCIYIFTVWSGTIYTYI